jgi:hypothetical protein
MTLPNMHIARPGTRAAPFARHVPGCIAPAEPRFPQHARSNRRTDATRPLRDATQPSRDLASFLDFFAALRSFGVMDGCFLASLVGLRSLDIVRLLVSKLLVSLNTCDRTARSAVEIRRFVQFGPILLPIPCIGQQAEGSVPGESCFASRQSEQSRVTCGRRGGTMPIVPEPPCLTGLAPSAGPSGCVASQSAKQQRTRQ